MSWTSSQAKDTRFDAATTGSSVPVGSEEAGRSVADERRMVGVASATDPAPGEAAAAAARSASHAAVRLLEIATRDADALVAAARAEADDLVAAARAEALERRDEAEREVARARLACERQRRDADQRVADAEDRVDQLVEVERRHRERLVAHFESQLEALSASNSAEALAASPAELLPEL